MGSCSSVDKNPDSIIRGRLSLAPKATGSVVASRPKDKPVNGEKSGAVFAVHSPDFGSKEDVFFDSRAWWDSDCEDDFFSVNGDFTPSGGSTPSRQTSAPFTPRLGNHFFAEKLPDSKSEPSPTGRKKLAELFQESTDDGQSGNSHNTAEQTAEFEADSHVHKSSSSVQPVKSVNESPYLSRVSSATSNEVTLSRHLKIRKERTCKEGNCCLPRLHGFAFDERKQKMNPGPCAV